MTVKNFLKDRCLLLILHGVCMCLLAAFLRLTGYEAANTGLILIFWTLILLVWLGTVYIQRKAYFLEAGQILEKTDQRYLLGELLPDSFRLEDKLYREMIRRSNKSVIERIRQIEEEQKDYKEYIESWVHEVKAPITSISLICENGRRRWGKEGASEAFGTACLENQRLENYVDMVLYYARSEEVYKDYLIQETNLQEAAYEVLEKNRLLLIQNNKKIR
jgi:signal transduction histidine kinase